MSVYAPAADYLWELIAFHDIDPRPVFEQVGLDPELRFQRDARVPRRVANELVDAAVAATGDPALGLRVVEVFHPSHMGALGFGLLASSTVRGALDKIQRHSRLVSDTFRLSLEERGGEARLRWWWEGDWDASPAQVYGNGALLTHLARMIGGESLDPEGVNFAAPEPPDRAPFEALFRCPMAFNAGHSELVFSVAELDRPVPRANPDLEHATEELIMRYLAHRDRTDAAGQVRSVLMEMLGNEAVDADIVAQRLNLSPRTLRRRLDEAGWTFRNLLADVRRQLALLYIQDHTLTLTQISYMLGFSEQSSFTRAFKGWTGESPTAARR